MIAHTCFGTTGSAVYPFNLGRTTAHEVGHYLNLYHLWGNSQGNCASDLVDDTPPQNVPLYTCEAVPYNANSTCGTDWRGEMVMNYMNYVDDYCMNMFSTAQAARMQATLVGSRRQLLYSSGCGPNALGVGSIRNNPIKTQSVYPNPATDIVNILNNGQFTVAVMDMIGRTVLATSGTNNTQIDVSNLAVGCYMLHITDKNGASSVHKLIKQ